MGSIPQWRVRRHRYGRHYAARLPRCECFRSIPATTRNSGHGRSRPTVAAIDRGQRGIYHIVDDEPAPYAVWIPFLAGALDRRPPFRIPTWLGRIAAGPAAVLMMTQSRGASNRKALRELNWAPRFASWREGFVHGLG